jgi:hypothetical protein
MIVATRLTCSVSSEKVRLATTKGKLFSPMFHRFQYESEFYPALSRIPLDVRRKLDLTGIKISLKTWLAFGYTERLVLCHLPVDSDEERQIFAAHLDFLSRQYCDRPLQTTDALNSDLWRASEVPEAVLRKSAAAALPVSLVEWARWQPHERYALYKMAISTNQPEAFAQILEQLRGPKGAG